MATKLEPKNPQKIPEKFSLRKCDYTCSKKRIMTKHLMTRKHKNGNK